MYKLMIKTHLGTGLKYLCSTKAAGKAFDVYTGSGAFWKKHLKANGRLISTEVIFETADYDVFQIECYNKSVEFDVVTSDKWANLIPESGCGTKGRTSIQRHKISEANRGKLRPDLAERNKLGVSEETRMKISASKKGVPNLKKRGFKHTEEAKAKMSVGHKGKPRGPKSEETKAKMAEARRAYWAKKRAA